MVTVELSGTLPVIVRTPGVRILRVRLTPPSERTSGEGLNAPGEASLGYTSLASISEAVIDAPRAPAVVDSPDTPAGSSQEDRPPVQASGDSNISPSDDLFTRGQPMNEDAAPRPVA